MFGLVLLITCIIVWALAFKNIIKLFLRKKREIVKPRIVPPKKQSAERFWAFENQLQEPGDNWWGR